MTNCIGGCEDYEDLLEKVDKYEKVIRALVVDRDALTSNDYAMEFCFYCVADMFKGEWNNVEHRKDCPYALARIAIGEPVKVEEVK
jgi:hypothetical protein